MPNKTALVTGASEGIGAEFIQILAARGYDLILVARSEDKLNSLAAKAETEFNIKCTVIVADLSQSKAAHNLFQRVQELSLDVNFLINNAGASWGEPYAEYSEKGWDKVMDLNVKSIFYLTQKLTPLLAKQTTIDDPARVINIGSIDGLNVPALESYAYGTSKAAVHHLTRVQAKRLVGENILVNAIAPGPYESMMLGAAVNHDYSFIESRNPRKRIGSPEDMAGLVLFLCSRAGAYTVGAIIPSDGGLVGTAGHDLSQS